MSLAAFQHLPAATPAPRRGRRLRVAHVALQLNMGGMEKLLAEFARHTDRSHFDLCFVALGGRGSVAEEIEAAGWEVIALGEPPGLRPGLVLRLARLFRKLKLDVVHTHNTKPLLYAAPAARLARVPTVIHTRHGQRFGATGREDAVFKWFSRLVNLVICVSKDSARLSLSEGLDPRRVCTIWNGIDLSRFAYTGPCECGPVVTVARLSPEKDVETLIRATAIAVAQDPAVRLEVAGDGACMPALKRLTAELGLERNVRFLGQVLDVKSLLAGARLFVLPSLTEGISLTLLEAMARGLPVVATRVGGNPEVVADGETGILTPSNDPVLLAEALLRIWRDPTEGHRMGLAGRKRVESQFDVRRTVAHHEELYLGGRRFAGQTAASKTASVRSVFGLEAPAELLRHVAP